jgi:hypothetical protein
MAWLRADACGLGLVFGIFRTESKYRMDHLLSGGIPLLIVSSVIWVLSIAIAFFRRDRSD